MESTIISNQEPPSTSSDYQFSSSALKKSTPSITPPIKSIKRLFINVMISTTFMAAEIVGGVVCGSLALIVDSFYIFTDIVGFFIIILGMQYTKRPASLQMTFGFYRAEVIGTLLSISMVWGVTAWFLSEVISRLISSVEVHGLVMLITAFGGIFGNFIMGISLVIVEKNAENLEISKEPTASLSIRSAFSHVLGDGIQNIAVMIASIVVYLRPDCPQVDSLCALLLCIAAIYTSLPIMKECIRILMEGSPSHLNILEIRNSLREIEDVNDVHDLHVSSLNSGTISLSCHLVSDNPNRVLDRATRMLKENFGINHVTIQIEVDNGNIKFECSNICI